MLLGLGTFAVRVVQPIGVNILNLQLCSFVQYIAAFVVGLHAARHGWLLTLAMSPQARRAGWLTLFISPIVLLTLMVAGTRAAPLETFFGGWHWQALGLAVWEQFAGGGLSLGLLALFSRQFNFEHPRLRWLADRSFGVYVLHAPILVGLAMLFRDLPRNLYGHVTLLTLTGLATSFLLADLLRRLPGLRPILWAPPTCLADSPLVTTSHPKSAPPTQARL